MSIKTDMAVPAHIAARAAARKAAGGLSALAQALASTPQPPRISIKSSRFRLVENTVETPVGIELDVVIVGANPHVSKVFFEGPWDPAAEDQRPDCTSADGKHPDADVNSPVCASCAKCPNNVLGSKITEGGNKSKLCSDVRYLAVVPASDPTKVYAFNVTVTAMKSLRQFTQALANYGVEVNEVVTQLTFDDEASYPKVVFNRGKFLPEAAIELVEQLAGHPDVIMATREDTAPQLDAPAASVAPRIAPTAEAEEEVDEEAAAEEAAAAKKAAALKKRRATAAAKKAAAVKAAEEAAAAEEEAEEEDGGGDDDGMDLAGIKNELAGLFG